MGQEYISFLHTKNINNSKYTNSINIRLYYHFHTKQVKTLHVFIVSMCDA